MQTSFKHKKPTLYIVSTPIGNLKDISYRAVEILKDVEAIFAEDTRTSGILLNHYQIKTQMYSYHEHNKASREEHVLSFLEKGADIALISDAGTPGINDPGCEIIQKVIQEGFYVVSIPGASAILAALVVSGLPMRSFTFIGFLPKKITEINQTLDSLKHHESTLVFYESPKRISQTLKLMFEIWGNRSISIGRELTKIYETIIRTDLKEALEMTHNPKGEYVIIVKGYQKSEGLEDLDPIVLVDLYIKKGLSEKEALKQVAKIKKTTKSEIYKVYKIEK